MRQVIKRDKSNTFEYHPSAESSNMGSITLCIMLEFISTVRNFPSDLLNMYSSLYLWEQKVNLGIFDREASKPMHVFFIKYCRPKHSSEEKPLAPGVALSFGKVMKMFKNIRLIGKLTLCAHMEPLGGYRVGLRSSFIYVSMIGVILRVSPQSLPHGERKI